MISHNEAQELHRIIGQVLLTAEGQDMAELERALELASIIVSDTEPEVKPERVIFRKFPHDNQVIALFPDQYNERNGNIMSYMHDGQHAETAPDFGDTVAADPFDYDYILHELRGQGYTNLRIVKRFGKLGRK